MSSILSDIQRKVLILKAGGFSCPQIAGKVHRSVHSVNSLLCRAYRDLGACNDVQAAVTALKLNLFTFDDIEFAERPPDL